jgi:hypothetical protein
LEEDRSGEHPLVVPAEPTPATSGTGSALVLLFLFFGIIGFGIFALVFLVLGLRDSRDALLCNAVCVGSLGLAAACGATFSLVIARTQPRSGPGSLRQHRQKA